MFGTWRRTHPGRMHGGVHMRNCGVSSSIQSRCKAVGADIHSSLVKRQLKNIQDSNDYHMTRKNSIKYKERQAILRRARFSDQEIIMENDKTYVKTFWILNFLRMITPDYIRKSQNSSEWQWEKHNLNNTIRERHMIFQTSLLRQTILPGIIYMWRF